MKRHLLSAIILSLVFCVAVACGEKKKDDSGGGGGDIIIPPAAKVPTFKESSIDIDAIKPNETGSSSFTIFYSQDAEYSLSYSENLAGVFTVAFESGCKLNEAKDNITIKKGGCTGTVTFKPTADEAKNYVGSITIGSASLSISGVGAKQDGTLPPAVKNIDLGVVGYFYVDDVQRGATIIDESKKIITITNNTDTARAISLTLKTSPKDFEVAVGSAYTEEFGDNHFPIIRDDSCFKDTTLGGFFSDTTASYSTVEVAGNTSCTFLISLPPFKTGETNILQGTRTLSLEVDNSDKGEELIVTFMALPQIDTDTGVYEFANTKVGSRSEAYSIISIGVDKGMVEYIKNGTLQVETVVTYPAGFFDNFKIDKQLSTCSISEVYTEQRLTPATDKNCYLYIYFQPSEAKPYSFDDGLVFEYTALKDFPEMGMKQGDIEPDESLKSSFKGTGN